VLLCTPKRSYLWVLACKHFDPGEDAYRAPFPNIYGDGHICWGANQPPEPTPANARKTWELFFHSGFNLDLANGKSRSQEDNVTLLLRSLPGRKSYPTNDLVPLHTRIGRLIEDTLKED